MTKTPAGMKKPPCTLVTNASEEDMKRDLGFIPEAKPKASAPMKHEH